MIKQKANAAEVFRRFGLEAGGFLRSIAVPPRGDGAGPGTRLKDAFGELGGLYLSFAQFLLWRADLLGVDYLLALRDIQQKIPPVPHATVAATLRRELGRRGEDLAYWLQTEPLWSTLSRTAYLSKYQGKPVVVQVAREPVSESDFTEFEAGIGFLGSPDVARVTAPAILLEFREWMRQAESCATERAYLEVLGRNREQMLVDYPALCPEITTDQVLCWPWVEGETLDSLIRCGSVEAVTQVAVAVLEQYCSLSIVDGDLAMDALVVAPGAARLTIRRFNRPLAVPLAVVNTGMKYVAAVLEGNASKVAQTLVNLALGKSTASLESSLLELMSAIEPELKVGLEFPKAAAAFESNWRALARLQVERPLFLNCLHRNLIATGYWTAEAIANGADVVDTITEAHWPVVGRVVRLNATQLLDPSVATEWGVGLGLLSFGAVREANRLAEEVRDNNLSVEVEVGPAQQSSSAPSRRNLPAAALIGFLLAIILATMRWGGSLTQPTQGVAVAVAYAALLVLFWTVAKLR